MFCQKCGNEIDDQTAFCAKCGAPVNRDESSAQPVQPAPSAQPVQPAQVTEVIPNHLVFAVITTVCCCLPFGIVAIIYSNQVNTKVALGDVQGAKEASNKAKIWCIVSLVSGFVVGLLYFLAAILTEVE